MNVHLFLSDAAAEMTYMYIHVMCHDSFFITLVKSLSNFDFLFKIRQHFKIYNEHSKKKNSFTKTIVTK